jgi:hypothetical protein
MLIVTDEHALSRPRKQDGVYMIGEHHPASLFLILQVIRQRQIRFL